LDSRSQTARRLTAAFGSVLACAGIAELAFVDCAGAEVLSPPPYAQQQSAQSAPPNALRAWSAPGASLAVRYSGMQVYDRYGGETQRSDQAARSQGGVAGAAIGPRLWWSGKVDDPGAAARPGAFAEAPAKGLYDAKGELAWTSTQPVQPMSGAPPRGWTFVPPIGQTSADQPALRALVNDQPEPVNIGASSSASVKGAAPRPPQADQDLADAKAETGPRHYSVHRDYGIEPDPIPLPPQFFGATADLSQPATDDPSRRAVTASGKVQNPLQPADGQ